MSTEVRIYKNPKKACKAVAREIKNLAAAHDHNRLDIALSGGNTPKKLFKILAEKYIDAISWDSIHFWWSDERCVPPDDKYSNFGLAYKYLFRNITLPKENIHRIRGENDPETEASRYSEEISGNLNYNDNGPIFDLIILGLGEDGHTASIFPDYPALIDEKKIAVVTLHPVSGQKRITFTGSTINNANRVFFLVTGENKAIRIAEIMNNDEAAKLSPAYYIEPQHGKLTWFLDEGAAYKIS
jgi:6-phosphogluconolactonase